MSHPKSKNKNRNVLSKGQNRLLRDSLKQLLGPGLIQPSTQCNHREEKASFLKEAFSSKLLDAEWLA